MSISNVLSNRFVSYSLAMGSTALTLAEAYLHQDINSKVFVISAVAGASLALFIEAWESCRKNRTEEDSRFGYLFSSGTSITLLVSSGYRFLPENIRNIVSSVMNFMNSLQNTNAFVEIRLYNAPIVAFSGFSSGYAAIHFVFENVRQIRNP